MLQFILVFVDLFEKISLFNFRFVQYFSVLAYNWRKKRKL